MELTPRTGLLSPDFKAYSIKNSGRKKEQAVDPESFYTGFLQGEYNAHGGYSNKITSRVYITV